MNVTVNRSSVAAGDDAIPHDEVVEVAPDVPLSKVVADLLARYYLATIVGGQATWILESDRPLAVVAQQWQRPRYLVDPDLPISSFEVDGRGVSLMFRYWLQNDPDHVFDELAAGRRPPRRP
ncbi:hypothetical protein J4573_27205 [Actinomadura barringtoniae]|uniref:Uncharacterized protein n=1 Tax=Actinomadura barringtoniae TaxID=1427535 RepID=A0A939PDW5_9ACTN|nr:hypothetical protein [Actinomadura barringtoniae]MBO2450815.1 hypothetical protein [Actinomadura barringtoniae]